MMMPDPMPMSALRTNARRSTMTGMPNSSESPAQTPAIRLCRRERYQVRDSAPASTKLPQ